jgi:hypothetical protein
VSAGSELGTWRLRRQIELQIVEKPISVGEGLMLPRHFAVGAGDQIVLDLHPQEAMMVGGLALERYRVSPMVIERHRRDHMLPIH